MSGNDQSLSQTLAAAFAGFVLVVGAGALAFFSGGSVSKVLNHAVHPAALPSSSELAAPARVPPTSSLPETRVGESAAPPPSPVPASPFVEAGTSGDGSALAPSAALPVTRHLDATQTSSAKAVLAVAPVPAEKGRAKAVRKSFASPKLDMGKTAGLAATVHYGVNRRSELMGRAAGPVYNLKGRGAKTEKIPEENISGQASVKIEEAQKQLEATELEEKDKKGLRNQFQQVRDAIDKPGQ